MLMQSAAIVLRTDLPEWAIVAAVGLSVLLALVTLVLLLRRSPAMPNSDELTHPRPQRLDLMLLFSTLAVLALAVAVLLGR
jgi:hypothetical protein